MKWQWFRLGAVMAVMGALGVVLAEESKVAEVEGQPLGANLRRVLQAMEYLGAPLPSSLAARIEEAAEARDAVALQRLVDPLVVATIEINPELRVKAVRGEGAAILQQHGYTPLLLKVWNLGVISQALNIESPQAGAVYSGASLGILQRQAQTELNADENLEGRKDRFLDVSLFRSSPMTPRLSGLEVEYVIALVSSSEEGKREATLRFDVGQGTQDLGFRSELPVLFDVKPAVAVPLKIREETGEPSMARLTFRDAWRRVYPPQGKRLAPDFFFQPHIYRADGESVWLPPGEFTLTVTRGPEYLVERRQVVVSQARPQAIEITLKRWVNPEAHGFYVGDHHIHGAGCSHYTSPMEGVQPEHMFRQVKGEGLNVGCVLTWGPCYDYQRQFFSPVSLDLSEPKTLLKYDVEVSGFGSAAMGHVCLLNLTDQTYPGSEGRSDRGWPTWTVPVMRWCQEQGGVTGYPHSAMRIDPDDSAGVVMSRADADGDGVLREEEAAEAVLPGAFAAVDENGDGKVAMEELRKASHEAVQRLPNLVLPSMDGKGAMEMVVSVPEGVCDFVSAMDTERLAEWNTWYHLMNCGFPLKLSGETDFPCMSSRRVGQGRVYVQLGQQRHLDFVSWVQGLADGRSYVSDGYAHALTFTVEGVSAGKQAVMLDGAGVVKVDASVAFAPEIPKAVAYGTLPVEAGRRVVGDTVNLHAERSEETVSNWEHEVELVVNASVVKRWKVPGDGKVHALTHSLALEKSSWVALRSFPQLHTNPVVVRVKDQPVRASRASALWCAAAVDLLWERRHRFIAAGERKAAREAYDRAVRTYHQIARESDGG